MIVLPLLIITDEQLTDYRRLTVLVNCLLHFLRKHPERTGVPEIRNFWMRILIARIHTDEENLKDPAERYMLPHSVFLEE